MARKRNNLDKIKIQVGAGWREKYQCNKVPNRNIEIYNPERSFRLYITTPHLILLASDISIIQAVVQLTRRWQKVAKMIKMK